MNAINYLFPYYGGKTSLAHWIISHFPNKYWKMHYVEPFAGGLSIFFNKKQSIGESISDLDKNLYWLYWHLRNNPTEIMYKIENTLYCEQTQKEAIKIYKDPKASGLDKGWAAWTLFNLAFAGVGEGAGFSHSFSNMKLTNKFNTKKSYLGFIHKRLSNAQIFNRKAEWFIEKFNDHENTLMYLDPPYPEADQRYKHRFNMSKFNKMMEMLYHAKFKWALSFYDKPGMNLNMFRENKKFTFLYKKTICRAATGRDLQSNIRTECLLINYKSLNNQLRLFNQ